MSAIKKVSLGYIAIIVMLTLWIAIALILAVQSWFAPTPPGAIKMDAIGEIALTSSVLNFAIPVLLVVFLVGLQLARKKLIPLGLPLSAALVVVVSSLVSWQWWQFMDDAHGTNISLTEDCLWWGRL